jgi:DNA polymerase-3 subunit epsilon
LPDVCRYLGIQLNHHNALSDAEACAQIVISAAQDGAEIRVPRM